METIQITETVSFQIGVDILGFPKYHHHIFADVLERKNQTQSTGKNMTKNKIIHQIKQYIFSVTN